MRSFWGDIVDIFKRGGLLFAFFCLMTYTCLGYSHVYLVCVFCVWVLVRYNPQQKMDRTGSLLLLFGIIHYLIIFLYGKGGGIVLTLANAFSPFIFYFYGKELVKLFHKEESMLGVLLIIMIFFLFPIFNNVIVDLNDVGIVNKGRMMGEEENELIKATILGMMTSIGLVGLPVFMSIQKPIKSTKALLFLALAILSLLTCVHLVNRSGIFIFVICIGVTLLYLSAKSKGRILFLLMILFAVLGYVMNQTFYGDIVNAYEERNLGDMGMQTAGGRTELWSKGVSFLFTHPFGWSDLIGYCHNLWLDVARDTGIISFVIVIVAFVRGHKPIFKLLKIKNSSWICALLGLNICFFVASFVEPVTHAGPYFFDLYCMFFGLQSATLNMKNSFEWDSKTILH